MVDTSILVLSCDKNRDLFTPFHYCLEKYWPGHPYVYYTTESIKNRYYETININYDVSAWTKRIRETLLQINSKFVLIMVDDLFLQSPVDHQKINSLVKYMGQNVVNINFEPTFDEKDIKFKDLDLLKRNENGAFLNSVMCGLWNRELLIKSLRKDENPWDFELEPPLNKGIYLITQNGDYLNWGYKKDPERADWHFGLHRGKWEKSCVEFLSHEGLWIDYSIRGIV